MPKRYDALQFTKLSFYAYGFAESCRVGCSGEVVMSILFCGSVKARRARVSTLYHAFLARVFTCSNILDAGKLLALALVVVLCIVVFLVMA